MARGGAPLSLNFANPEPQRIVHFHKFPQSGTSPDVSVILCALLFKYTRLPKGSSIKNRPTLQTHFRGEIIKIKPELFRLKAGPSCCSSCSPEARRVRPTPSRRPSHHVNVLCNLLSHMRQKVVDALPTSLLKTCVIIQRSAPVLGRSNVRSSAGSEQSGAVLSSGVAATEDSRAPLETASRPFHRTPKDHKS